MIQPMHGEKPKATLTKIALTVIGPLIPLLLRLAPKHATTTERMGRAMLAVAKNGAAKKVLESADINELAAGPHLNHP